MRRLSTDENDKLHELANLLVNGGMLREAFILVYGRAGDIEHVIRRPDVQLAAALSNPELFDRMIDWLDEGQA